jgi:hypothetical protein
MITERNRGHSALCALRKEQNVPNSSQDGLTYVEIMIALVVLVVGLVPALDALRSAQTGTAASGTYVIQQHRLSGRLEEVLAEPFTDLDAEAMVPGNAPTAYSDPPGTPDRLLIFLSRYDGDNADADGDPFTGVDQGLLWVRAEIADTVYDFETLITE